MTAQPVVVRAATVADLPRLAPLWTELYAHQVAHGMRLPIPPNGFGLWLGSIEPLLGRFATVSVAERSGALVGFVAGRVRSLPPYFGAGMSGFISEVYVAEPARGGGAGRRLLELTLEWFAAVGITRVELQVLAGNPGAVGFYRDLGWHEELVQMVWERK